MNQSSKNPLSIANTADGYCCRSCPLISSVAVTGTTFRCDTAEEMIEHLDQHRRNGYVVPREVLARLRGEQWADEVVDALPDGVMPTGYFPDDHDNHESAVAIMDDGLMGEEEAARLADDCLGGARARWDELVKAAQECCRSLEDE